MRPETVFMSDLHLTAERPEIVSRFLGACAGPVCGAERLFILGDLFDAYIGDDNQAWPFSAVKAALRTLSDQGTRVYLQPGNRDFLLGNPFEQQTRVTLLDDHAVIDLHGTPTLLMHGDLLCTDDHQYQAARVRVRSPEWRAYALGKPLWMRKLYARWYRFKSGLDKSGKSLDIMDINHEAAVEAVRQHGVRRLIHGHTHRPGRFELAAADLIAERFVLPEWNGGEWLLVFDAEGYREVPIG